MPVKYIICYIHTELHADVLIVLLCLRYNLPATNIVYNVQQFAKYLQHEINLIYTGEMNSGKAINGKSQQLCGIIYVGDHF